MQRANKYLLLLPLTILMLGSFFKVSVFVAVLRMFLNYGLSGRTPITLLVGHSKKDLNNVSPKAHKEQLNKSNHSVYRPPHLRKRDCSNVNPNRATSSQYISDSESSTINVTSSDSDFSDGDGSAKESARVQNSRIRVAAIICIQDLCQADSKSFSMQWSLLLPTSDALQPRYGLTIVLAFINSNFYYHVSRAI